VGRKEVGRKRWIDERKGITRFGEREGKRPSAGLVYVDEGVAKISIDLVNRVYGSLCPQENK
jgi:imidazoleglycerol phosphate dehydratase HisB